MRAQVNRRRQWRIAGCFKRVLPEVLAPSHRRIWTALRLTQISANVKPRIDIFLFMPQGSFARNGRRVNDGFHDERRPTSDLSNASIAPTIQSTNYHVADTY